MYQSRTNISDGYKIASNSLRAGLIEQEDKLPPSVPARFHDNKSFHSMAPFDDLNRRTGAELEQNCRPHIIPPPPRLERLNTHLSTQDCPSYQ